MRQAVRVHITEAETRQLISWSQAPDRSPRRARRARIVLLAADGWTNQRIADTVHLHPETVGLWRRRFVSNRVEGIRMDAPRSGPRRRSARLRARIARATERASSNPKRTWTTRTLAKRFRVSHMTVYRAWHDHPRVTNRLPECPVKEPADGRDEPVEMEGVFLHPPRRAAVFQVDRGQQLPWLAPGSPLSGSETVTLSGDLGRGLSVLFHRWKRSATCRPGSLCSVADLLVFLRMVERRAPAPSSFMVLYEGFSRAAESRVVQWTRAHPRFSPVRVPAGTTWFKAVNRCLGDAPASAPLASPGDKVLRPLTESLATYLQTNPAAPAPFVWTPPAVGEGPSGPAGPSAPD